MKIYKVAYTEMDWSKSDQLRDELFDLDINFKKWASEQESIIEVDVSCQNSLRIMLKLEIINQELYNELFSEVDTLFLS